jgi:hypothetical protein
MDAGDITFVPVGWYHAVDTLSNGDVLIGDLMKADEASAAAMLGETRTATGTRDSAGVQRARTHMCRG